MTEYFFILPWWFVCIALVWVTILKKESTTSPISSGYCVISTSVSQMWVSETFPWTQLLSQSALNCGSLVVFFCSQLHHKHELMGKIILKQLWSATAADYRVNEFGCLAAQSVPARPDQRKRELQFHQMSHTELPHLFEQGHPYQNRQVPLTDLISYARGQFLNNIRNLLVFFTKSGWTKWRKYNFRKQIFRTTTESVIH